MRTAHDLLIYFGGHEDVIVNYMDDEIREKLHWELTPCTFEEFLEAYMEEHKKKFGYDFVIN